MNLIYVAGPYRGKCEAEVFSNIVAARSVAARIWELGMVAVCPHLNTAFMGGIVDDSAFLRGDIELMLRCDAVYAIPGWERSKGAAKEIDTAREQEMPVHLTFEALCRWNASGGER